MSVQSFYMADTSHFIFLNRIHVNTWSGLQYGYTFFWALSKSWSFEEDISNLILNIVRSSIRRRLEDLKLIAQCRLQQDVFLRIFVQCVLCWCWSCKSIILGWVDVRIIVWRLMRHVWGCEDCYCYKHYKFLGCGNTNIYSQR